MEIDEFVLARAVENEAIGRHLLAAAERARKAVAAYRDQRWVDPDSLRGLAGLPDDTIPRDLADAAAQDFDHPDYRPEWVTAATSSRSTASTASGSSIG